MERDAFLRRLRERSPRHLPEAPSADPGLLVPDLPEVELVEQFTTAAERVDARVHHPPGDPLETVARILSDYQTDTFIAWDPPELIPGLVSGLLAAGFAWRRFHIPNQPEDRRRAQQAMHDVKVGITGAEAGFAESGSVVLRSGAGRPRLASLLPLVHVVVLSRRRIRRSLAHWMAEKPEGPTSVSNLVVVTGPSRTGDIEMLLNLGVHGPRYLEVVLVP